MCANRRPHDQQRLMLTQIIAGNSLEQLGRQMHEVRSMWGIAQHCGCALSKETTTRMQNTSCKEAIADMIAAQTRAEDVEEMMRYAVSQNIDPVCE